MIPSEPSRAWVPQRAVPHIYPTPRPPGFSPPGLMSPSSRALLPSLLTASLLHFLVPLLYGAAPPLLTHHVSFAQGSKRAKETLLPGSEQMASFQPPREDRREATCSPMVGLIRADAFFCDLQSFVLLSHLFPWSHDRK